MTRSCYARGVDTPLSDAISALVADQRPENWNRFFETLLGSHLGVIARGQQAGTTGAIQTKNDNEIGVE